MQIVFEPPWERCGKDLLLRFGGSRITSAARRGAKQRARLATAELGVTSRHASLTTWKSEPTIPSSFATVHMLASE